MQERNSWFPPKQQVFVIGVAALTLYFLLARPRETARDVLVVDYPAGQTFAFLAADLGGVFILDATDPEALAQVGAFAFEGPALGLHFHTYEDGRQILFVAAGNRGLRVLDVSDPAAPDEIGYLVLPGEAQGGVLYPREDKLYFLLAGGESGLHILDVTEPTQPSAVTTLNTGGFIEDVVAWEAEETAFLADHRAGLVAVNLENIRNLNPSKPPDETGSYRVPGQPHELLLEGNLLYVASGPAGLAVVNVANPEEMELAGDFSSLPDARSLDRWQGYVYIADTRRGVRALNTIDLNNIYDVTKERYGAAPRALEVHNGSVFVGDGLQGLRVFSAEVSVDAGRKAITPPALQANHLAQVGSNLLYIASPDQGLVVVNVSQPANPEIQEIYSEYSHLLGVTAGTNYAYLARGETGVSLVAITNPEQPVLINTIKTAVQARSALPVGDYLYVADGPGGLQVYDISNPAAPLPVANYGHLGEVHDVVLAGDRYVLAAASSGVFILDARNPAIPEVVGRIDVRNSARSVFVEAATHRAYIADWSHGLIIADLQNLPQAPILGRYDSPGYVYDVWVSGTTAFLADGYRGLALVDVSNPANPQPVNEGGNETPGDARAIGISGANLYLADGNRGLRIYDISQPATPAVVGVLDAPQGVQDLILANNLVYAVDAFRPDVNSGLWIFEDPQARRLPESLPPQGFVDIPPNNQEPRGLFVSGKRGYLAAGQIGLRIVDLNNPADPTIIEPNIPLPDLGPTRRVAVQGDIAYLTAGVQGLWLVDVSQPFTPTVVFHYPTPREAGDIVVRPLGDQLYAYVADGGVGIRVLNVTRPENVTPVSVLSGVGVVRRLRFEGSLAYLASAGPGLVIADMSDPARPAVRGQAEAGQAWDVAVQDAYVYLAGGDEGLRIYNAADPASPQLVAERVKDIEGPVTSVEVRPGGENPATDIVFLAGSPKGVQALALEKVYQPKQLAFFETPGTAEFGQAVKAALGFLLGKEGWITQKGLATVRALVFDYAAAFFVFAFMLVFFSQFVLPLRTLDDRGTAIVRLVFYLFYPGPALTIRDGVIKQRDDEFDRKGPGVILLDSASAAVLRTVGRITRTVGPGLVFTVPGERIAGTVALNGQSGRIGPLDEEDSFTSRGKSEQDDEFQRRQDRRLATVVQLRDGNEVVASIRVNFRIDCEPGEGGTAYGYSEEAVRRCVLGEGLNPDSTPPDRPPRVSWQDLPTIVAADVWREYVRKFTLEEFFTYRPSSLEVEETGFEAVQRLLRARLTQPRYRELTAVGGPADVELPSNEFQILKERGIRVLAVSVIRMQFEPQVERQIIRQWEASWQGRARQEVDFVERRRSRAFHEGQEQGLRDLAVTVAEDLVNQPEVRRRTPAQRVERILERIRRLCFEDAALHRRLTVEERRLQEILDWLRSP